MHDDKGGECSRLARVLLEQERPQDGDPDTLDKLGRKLARAVLSTVPPTAATGETPITDAHDRAILAASEEARAVKYGCLELARKLERKLAEANRNLTYNINRADNALASWKADKQRADYFEARLSSTAAPVAWRYRYRGDNGEQGDWKFVDSEDECNPMSGYERQALYAAPQSARGTHWEKIIDMPDVGAPTDDTAKRDDGPHSP